MLVVEDEWFVREHVVTELKAQGWSVVETATGENALTVLATDDVHLLLTDIQLAGAIDGWEVARALRAKKKPDFPVIYASGTPPDPVLRVEGRLSFNKPYDPVDVVAACQKRIGAERCLIFPTQAAVMIPRGIAFAFGDMTAHWRFPSPCQQERCSGSHLEPLSARCPCLRALIKTANESSRLHTEYTRAGARVRMN